MILLVYGLFGYPHLIEPTRICTLSSPAFQESGVIAAVDQPRPVREPGHTVRERGEVDPVCN